MMGSLARNCILLCCLVMVVESLSYKKYYNKHKKEKELLCSEDKQCNAKQTCNMYSKFCEKCRYRGEICRRGGNCCNKGLECVYGKCLEPLKKEGGKGHKCQSDGHCNPGMCCAKYKGVSVCRPQLEEFQICHLSPGGINHSIDHHCPCADGLHCREHYVGFYTARCLRMHK